MENRILNTGNEKEKIQFLINIQGKGIEIHISGSSVS